MLTFSQNLTRSLSRAIAQAEQQCYNYATPEHLVLALLDDPDAIAVVRACNVDVEKLRGAVLASMPHHRTETSVPDELDDTADSDDSEEAPGDVESDEALEEDGRIPVEHFQPVLRRAIAQARSSGCEEVNSPHVLVALLDRSVGGILNEQGLTRYDATTFICHGIGKDGQATSPRADVMNRSASPASSAVAETSSTFKIKLLNDAYTPMDFVVHILEQVIGLAHEDAERVMLETHHEGAGACGSFTREEAEAKVAQVMNLARQHQHPLRCEIVEE